MVIGIDLIAAYTLVRDHFAWETVEPLMVDRNWLDLAKETGLIDAGRDYVWSDIAKAESRCLSGTHEFIWLLDKKQRTKRQARHGELVLLTKAGQPA
jgi:hypothetical protein